MKKTDIRRNVSLAAYAVNVRTYATRLTISVYRASLEQMRRQ